MLEHVITIPFVFLFGSIFGSFLNVVMYRMPLNLSVIWPPSSCPNCKTKLGPRDNIPIWGWLLLKGKCRYCGNPISARYPIIEAITASLFVFYYVMFFICHAGPNRDLWTASPDSWFIGSMTSFIDDWPIYFLDMALVSGLLAASLIDAESFIIPAGIPWFIAGLAVVIHAIIDRSYVPGNVLVSAPSIALTIGSGIGLLGSIILLKLQIFPLSFPEGDIMEQEREELEREASEAAEKGHATEEIPPEYTGAEVRREIRKEMLFLLPPLILGALCVLLYARVPDFRRLFQGIAAIDWLNGGLGALLGGMVGGFIVWITRILGSLGFGKEAMGLGDIHLMFGVGAVLGGGPAAVAFLLAPFFAILWALYIFFARSHRQLPFGPFLSLATGYVMLFYSPIVVYYRPGLMVIMENIRKLLNGHA